MAPADDLYQALLADCAAELAGFRIVRKETVLSQRLIHRLLVALTLGGQRRYLDGYQTTIGRTVYVTADWDERPAEERLATLRHERIHLRQFRRFGIPLMALLYLALPLPFGLAYFRMRFEREAYEESLRAWAEVYGPEYLRRAEVRAHVIKQFTGPAYGWMWPFPRAVASWYDVTSAATVGPRSESGQRPPGRTESDRA